MLGLTIRERRCRREPHGHIPEQRNMSSDSIHHCKQILVSAYMLNHPSEKTYPFAQEPIEMTQRGSGI